MITSLHITQNLRLLHHRKEGLIDQEIIQPFPDISLPVSILNPPPSILFYPRIQFPKSINPTHIQEPFDALPLLRRESRVLVRIRREVDVDFLVADVQITADDHSFAFLLEALAVTMKGFLVLLSLVEQPLQFLVACTRDVNRYQVKMLELQSDDPSFLAVRRLFQILKDGNGQKLRKHCDSRISRRNLAKVPVSIVPFECDWALFKGLLVDLGLIDADDIRIAGVDEIVQCILVEHASYAIYVPHSDLDPVTRLATTQHSTIGLLLLQPQLAVAKHFFVEFPRSRLDQWLTHIFPSRTQRPLQQS